MPNPDSYQGFCFVGLILIRNGKILLGKRKGAHALQMRQGFTGKRPVLILIVDPYHGQHLFADGER